MAYHREIITSEPGWKTIARLNRATMTNPARKYVMAAKACGSILFMGNTPTRDRLSEHTTPNAMPIFASSPGRIKPRLTQAESRHKPVMTRLRLNTQDNLDTPTSPNSEI